MKLPALATGRSMICSAARQIQAEIADTRVARRAGASVEVVPSDERGEVSLDALADMLDERVGDLDGKFYCLKAADGSKSLARRTLGEALGWSFQPFGDDYFVVVNASNTDKDYEWLASAAKGMDVDVPAQTQGPTLRDSKAAPVVGPLSSSADAPSSPSMTRALSRSVCRRPMNHVPVLDKPL